MLAALLIVRFLGFLLLIQYGGQLQAAVKRSPSITLPCFHGFNLTLHFMAGSMNLQTVCELIKTGRRVKVHSCRPVTLGDRIEYIVQFNCSTYRKKS